MIRAPRLAVIGAGAYGTLHLEVYRAMQRDGLVELAGIAARSEQTAERQAKAFDVPGYTDVDALLDKQKPDAVSVVTPDQLHYEHTMAAVRRGLHVLVEKPMTLTVEEAERIVAASREAGVIVFVDYHKRLDPALAQARALVAEGKIGRIEYGYACMECQITMPRDLIRAWVTKTNPSRLLGIHLYDALRWLIDDEVSEVRATATRGKLDSIGVDVVDAIQAHLTFRGGAQVTVHTSWAIPETFEAMINQDVKLIGTDGIVEVDLQNRGIRHATGDAATATPNPLYIRRHATGPGAERLAGYAPESIENFARTVRSLLAGTPLADLAGTYPDANDGLAGIRIACAIDESIKTGDSVRIDGKGDAE